MTDQQDITQADILAKYSVGAMEGVQEENKRLRAQVEALSQYPEDAVRAVYEYLVHQLIGEDVQDITIEFGYLSHGYELAAIFKEKQLQQEDKHNWKCISPGDYDTTYACAKCGEVNVEQADNLHSTANPVYGCKEKQGVGK